MRLKNFWNSMRGNKSRVQNTNPSDSQHGLETSDIISLEDYQFLKLPEYVGQWWINPNFAVSVEHKPNIFHRYMTTLMLGWKWKDL